LDNNTAINIFVALVLAGCGLAGLYYGLGALSARGRRRPMIWPQRLVYVLGGLAALGLGGFLILYAAGI
jgi:hypothetical protein